MGQCCPESAPDARAVRNACSLVAASVLEGPAMTASTTWTEPLFTSFRYGADVCVLVSSKYQSR